MATLKRRLYKKNSSGTYDTVYLETSAELITGTLSVSHGGTGVTSIDSLKDSLGISSNKLVFGDIELGNNILLSGVNGYWVVVHVDINNNEFVVTPAASDNTSLYSGTNSNYSESYIIAACSTFESRLPTAIKNAIIPKNIHGVTQKVWIPQVNWISNTNPSTGGASSWSGTNVFEYFSTDSRRIVKHIDGRILAWWTASSFDNTNVYIVTTGGSITFVPYNNSGGYTNRYFIALPIVY